MADVFISYARAEKEFAQTLGEALRARGKDVWIDLDDIPPTAPWRAEVEGGIESADAFLFVISPASLASAECAHELEHAARLNKRIVPVVRQEVDGAGVPEPLAAPNWVFLRDGDSFESGVGVLIGALDLDLDWVRVHTRLGERALEWEKAGHDSSRLLRGSDLAEAETWLGQESEDREPEPTALQRRFVLASRQASTRRQRTVLGAVAVALLVAVGLAIFALVQRDQAIDQRERALSRELASGAVSSLDTDPELSILLATEAMRRNRTEEAEDALRQALARSKVEVSLRGHRGQVNAAAWSPDGRRAVTAGDDRTARVWDVRTGRELAELRGHRRFVTGAAFSADGARVVTGSWDGTVRLWDAGDGRPVRTLETGPGRVNGVGAAPRGNLVAVAGSDGTASVWNLRTGRRVAVMRGHRGEVQTAAFDGSARRLVTSGDDGTARVWALPQARQVRVLRGHGDVLNGAAFSPDGRSVVTASSDQTARVWSAASGRPRHVLRGHGDIVTSASFSPDGRRLVTTSWDRTARVWDAGGAPLETLAGHDTLCQRRRVLAERRPGPHLEQRRHGPRLAARARVGCLRSRRAVRPCRAWPSRPTAAGWRRRLSMAARGSGGAPTERSSAPCAATRARWRVRRSRPAAG